MWLTTFRWLLKLMMEARKQFFRRGKSIGHLVCSTSMPVLMGNGSTWHFAALLDSKSRLQAHGEDCGTCPGSQGDEAERGTGLLKPTRCLCCHVFFSSSLYTLAYAYHIVHESYIFYIYMNEIVEYSLLELYHAISSLRSRYGRQDHQAFWAKTSSSLWQVAKARQGLFKKQPLCFALKAGYRNHCRRA